MARIIAFFKLRCPHCLQGKIFAGLWRMNETCPVCGIHFERETGYFMNAIFLGYVFGIAAVVPVSIWLYLIEAPVYWVFIAPAAVLIPLAPLLFRYSRALWLHIDELLDPRP